MHILNYSKQKIPAQDTQELALSYIGLNQERCLLDKQWPAYPNRSALSTNIAVFISDLPTKAG